MAKQRKCPTCDDGVIKNHRALRCWKCYNSKIRYLVQYNVSKHAGSGNKHPNWKGGKWLYWRRQTLIRDNFTCQKCGLRDEEIMDVDHINPKLDSSGEYKNNIQDINNLQTLCPNCHKRKTLQETKFYTGHLKSR